MNTPQRTDFRDKGEQAGSTAGRKVGETLEKARDTASALAEKAGEKMEGAYQKAQDVASKAQDMASNAGQAIRETASHVGAHAHEAYDLAAEKACEFNDDVVRLIHRHPRQAVMIGFGAGCLIGAVLLGGLFASSRRA